MLLFIVTTPLRVSQQISNNGDSSSALDGLHDNIYIDKEVVIDHEYAAEAYDDDDDDDDNNNDIVRYDDKDDNDDLQR